MADKIVEQESEGRYGWGTQAAVDTLFKKLGESKYKNGALVMVNIDTLVRNTADGKMKVEEVVSKVCQYMTNIATDFANVVSDWVATENTIIFYHANNSRVVLPIALRVTKSAAGLQAKEALNLILERVKRAPEQKVRNVRSIVAVGNNVKQPSYRGIVDLASRYSPTGMTINLISHNPIDWHIESAGRKGILYRSYTGVAVDMTPANLGPMVFDNPNIPFTPITHVLFGDKNVIRGFMRGQDKEKFLELARHDKFIYRTEQYIISRAKVNVGLLPYHL